MRAEGLYVVFSLGQTPETLHLAYQGERKPENLQPVRVTTTRNGKVRLEGISPDELDDADRAQLDQEINEWSVDQHLNTINRQSFTMLPPEDPAPQAVFDPERVYSAISSTALEEESEQPWHTLPAKVAVDIFREILSGYDFDDLYDILSDDPDSYPMGSIRDQFNLRVRNTGILSYRLITHARWQPLPDDIYNPSELRCSPVYNMPITPYKLLRERGIRVIAAGFLELNPPDSVLDLRLESWGTPWAAETRAQTAHYNLEAGRASRRGMIEAKKALKEDFDAVKRILNNQSNESLSLEEMAFRVFLAVETLAKKEDTRKYLTGESVTMIRDLRDVLLPGDRFGGAGSIFSIKDDK